MTLDAAHSGLAAEHARHQKLQHRWRQGLIDASEWKHHAAEHYASVNRWRTVLTLAQTTMEHQDVSHALITKDHHARVMNDLLQNGGQRGRKGGKQSGGSGEGGGEEQEEQKKRMVALENKVVVMQTTLATNRTQMAQQARERAVLNDTLHETNEHVNAMVVREKELLLGNATLVQQMKELKEMLTENKGHLKKHAR